VLIGIYGLAMNTDSNIGSGSGESMRLIIGGAFQGKTEYAKRAYPEAECLNGLHERIREDVRQKVCVLEKTGKDTARTEATTLTNKELQTQLEEYWITLLEEKIRKNPQLCILCDEVGMGVVPMQAWERIYREVTGHICIYLAGRAESVERIVCGCSQRIK
jgi:adenosylcobinamide kinase/adenosylcobinamide-phosphate guanylyltransferase